MSDQSWCEPTNQDHHILVAGVVVQGAQLSQEEKLKWCGYSQSVSGTLDRPPDVWLPDGEIFFKDMSIRFERIHERDGRTGGHRTTA